MPEENKAAEAIEAAEEVAEALAKVDEDEKDKRPSVGPLSNHKIRSLAALILAGASLLATLGTFIKTCDHSVTENAYDTLAQNITKLSDNQEKLGQDLANLHGYLEGMRGLQRMQGQLHTAQVTIPTTMDGGETTVVTPTRSWTCPPGDPLCTPPNETVSPTVRPTKPTKPPASSKVTFSVMQWEDAGVIAFAPAAPTLPPVSPPPAPVAPPTFDIAAAKK
jgi:hypothetical protein